LEDLAEDMEAVEVLDLTEDAEENLPLENLPLEIRDAIFKSLNIRRLWSSWTWCMMQRRTCLLRMFFWRSMTSFRIP
jgi:hypothetical protein